VPIRATRIANVDDVALIQTGMHEDARRLTELSATLGSAISRLDSADHLYHSCGDFQRIRLHIPATFAIPGTCVAAFLYAASASLVALVGRSLIDRNAERYERERSCASRLFAQRNIDAIAVAAEKRGGAAYRARSRQRVVRDAQALTGVMNLTGHSRLWMVTLWPNSRAAPLYFAGTLTFGGLMMASGAFVQFSPPCVGSSTMPALWLTGAPLAESRQLSSRTAGWMN